MDSEDSRPGSSASNSSSNSSQASVQSPNHYEDKNYEMSHNAGASPTSSSGSRRSRRSGTGSPNSRPKSKSESDSSSNTSLSDEDGDDDETKSSNNANPEKNSVSSENGKNNDDKGNLSNSASPMSRRSSRDSSSSSNRSRSVSGERHQNNSELNITHDDLSDVSDLESEKRSSNSKTKLSIEDTNSIDEKEIDNSNENEDIDKNITDLRQKLEKKKYQLNDKCETSPRDAEKILVKDKTEESLEDLVKPNDEDALDFEAEEGECHETTKNDENKESEKDKNITDELNKLTTNDNEKDEEELEEGEVSDEDEKRPEETEPKPVCRFYTRGQCTWGMSCRFLHPGVTDKGNYTMFDLVRPVPLPQSGSTVGNRASNYSVHAADFHDYRSERPAIHHRSSSLHHTASVFPASNETRKVIVDGPVVVESAWERGLRTAKEMMRKANKRKEQDMDFEDKKMNLTLSPDELEKEPYYLKDILAPTEGARHPLYEPAAEVYSAADRYGRGPPLNHYDEIDPYGRSTRYRELPPHRMPQYEDERRVRPTREVIVQRVEPLGRSDDWNDPWMRSKSPNGRGGSREHGDKRRRERRSYSSNSSYTSSSSSQSDDSSSESSRSPSPRDRHRRRYNSSSHKASPSAVRRAGGRNMRSLTPPPRKPRGTSSLRQSPSFKRRPNVSPPPYNRGGAYSPVHKRKRLSPLTKTRSEKSKIKRTHSSSSSDSDSTGSESESDSGSSSSESSSQSQDHTPPKRLRISEKLTSNERKGLKKDIPKKRSPISIELKKPNTVGISALTSPSHANPIEKDSKKSRREELLKQLRAVEDAIAKKRSKLV